MTENNFDLIHTRFTYKNIPLYKLEKYSFNDPQAAYDSFKGIAGISEVVILQTASRVEAFFVAAKDAVQDMQALGGGTLIAKIRSVWISLTTLDQYDLDHFDQTLEIYKNSQVYPHMLELATGLDSIVVGKEEILREMKSSLSNAKKSGMSGNILGKLFDTVIRIGTKIRKSTGIGDDVITIGDVAVKMAEGSVGIDAKKKLLLIGTGHTAALVAKSLNLKAHKFDVVSKTIDRATGFSKILRGTPVEFEDVLLKFDKYDVVFVATTADYHVLTSEQLKRVMEGKKTGTMILDISEPRAVNEDVSSIPTIKLMFREQIAEQEEANLQARTLKIPQVEEMIGKETPIIEAMMNKLEHDPLVPNLFASVDVVRRNELEKAIQELGETDAAKIQILENLTKSLVSKVASPPVQDDKKVVQPG